MLYPLYLTLNTKTTDVQLFFLAMQSDSIEDIFDTLKQCAVISKWAGGVGLHVHCIRTAGSYIAGINGHSNGLVTIL